MTLILLLFAGSTSLLAQMATVRPGDLDPHLDSLFTSGRFSHLEIEALRMLHAGREVSQEERVAAHLYLGFTWVLNEREQDARNAFLEALILEPGLDLDEVYVPPRLFEAFQRARADFLEGRDLYFLPRAGVPHLPHYRLGTGLNLLLPGSGFVASGRHLRGTLWGVAFLGCGAAFVHAYMEADDAHETYLRQSNPALIEDRYEEYNRWYKRASIFAFASAAIYLGAQLDYQLADGFISAEPALLDVSNGVAPGMTLSYRR